MVIVDMRRGLQGRPNTLSLGEELRGIARRSVGREARVGLSRGRSWWLPVELLAMELKDAFSIACSSSLGHGWHREGTA